MIAYVFQKYLENFTFHSNLTVKLAVFLTLAYFLTVFIAFFLLSTKLYGSIALKLKQL